VWELSSGLLLCTFSFSSEVTAVVMDNADYRVFAGTSTGRIYQINCFDEVSITSLLSYAFVAPVVEHRPPMSCLHCAQFRTVDSNVPRVRFAFFIRAIKFRSVLTSAVYNCEALCLPHLNAHFLNCPSEKNWN